MAWNNIKYNVIINLKTKFLFLEFLKKIKILLNNSSG